MKYGEIETVETCGGCPHCYHFYQGDKEIGGIRYRWGHFQCWPTVNGNLLDNIIDVDGPEDHGILPYENKDKIVETCMHAVVDWHNGHHIYNDVIEYIEDLLNE